MPTKDEIDQQLVLLGVHRQHLAVSLKQKAHFGAHTPPYVFHSIREARSEIRRIKELLSSWGVKAEDHPDDDEPPPSDDDDPDNTGTYSPQTKNQFQNNSHIEAGRDVNIWNTVQEFIANTFHLDTDTAVKASLKTLLICTLLLYLLATCAYERLFCFIILMVVFCPFIFFYALLGYNWGKESGKEEIKQLGSTLLLTSLAPYMLAVIFVVVRLAIAFVQLKLKGSL